MKKGIVLVLPLCAIFCCKETMVKVYPDVFPGNSSGSSCSVESYCAGHLVCVVQSGADAGTCRETCSGNRNCPEDTVCTVVEGESAACIPFLDVDTAIGRPCIKGEEQCFQGVCVEVDAGRLCARQCGDGGPCPSVASCLPAKDTAGNTISVCRPIGSTGSRKIGDQCPNGGSDCESGICADLGYGGFCSSMCGSDEECPAGRICRQGTVSGTGDAGVCALAGGNPGEACEDGKRDCLSGICYSRSGGPGLCTRRCRDRQDCLEDWRCTFAEALDGKYYNLCYRLGQVGDWCANGSIDCASGLCVVRAGENSICSKECASDGDCPQGFTCAQVIMRTGVINACMPE